VETQARMPIEWLKLQVIFSDRATDYRVLSWKMTYTDKASYASGTVETRARGSLPGELSRVIYIYVNT